MIKAKAKIRVAEAQRQWLEIRVLDTRPYVVCSRGDKATPAIWFILLHRSDAQEEQTQGRGRPIGREIERRRGRAAGRHRPQLWEGRRQKRRRERHVRGRGV